MHHSSWQDPGGLQRSVGHRQSHESWPHPEGKTTSYGLSSYSCNCLSLGLCLGGGAPGYQIGLCFGQWFLGLDEVICLWTSPGSIWSPGYSGYLGKHGLTWQFFLCGKGEVKIDQNAKVIGLHAPARPHPQETQKPLDFDNSVVCHRVFGPWG